MSDNIKQPEIDIYNYVEQGTPNPEANLFNEAKGYLELHKDIVENSFEILNKIIEKKDSAKKELKDFFILFLIFQLIVIISLIIINYKLALNISDIIKKVLIISVFAETLGIVGFMVKFYFNPKEEIAYIATIQKVAEKYKRKNDLNNEE
ncbi:MAG: hypothetical protein FWE36_05775 [Erysipelotrichales bacterium]|nr:hypothetical protein [Erysipelotrichales bacterium]